MAAPSSGFMSGSERASSTSASTDAARRHVASGDSRAASWHLSGPARSWCSALRCSRYWRMCSARSR